MDSIVRRCIVGSELLEEMREFVGIGDPESKTGKRLGDIDVSSVDVGIELLGSDRIKLEQQRTHIRMSNQLEGELCPKRDELRRAMRRLTEPDDPRPALYD